MGNDIGPEICMVFDDHGNAFESFDYTPEDLEAHALALRKKRGEITTVTVGASAFTTATSSERRAI